MTREFDENLHLIFYEYDIDGRNYWECQTCSSGGSVPDSRDPEIAAERSHPQRGVTHLATTNKRRWT
jgi:hypothetical protein